MAKYEWKPGGPKPVVDAQVFGDVVEQIAGELDCAKPSDIVEAARDRKSPIHKLFNWDNDDAAELYRQQQARHFVGALQIVRVEFSKGQHISSRAFFHVRTEARGGYMGQDRILGDADLTKQVLEDARKELENYLRKFGAVMALGTLVPRLQAIVEEMRETADLILVEATTPPQPRRRRGRADTVHPAP